MFTKAEIIAVGTELLLGNIVNTNAQFLSVVMASLGYDMYYQSVVGDNMERATDCMKAALCRSDVVIVTGGLGPTPDDISKEAAAEAVGLELFEDEESIRAIESYFLSSGRTMSESNRKQALFPKERCIIFPNVNGTAPGCAMTAENGSVIILMPGVPSEMKMMFESYVKPFLSKKNHRAIVSHSLLIAGVGESMLTSKIPDFIGQNNPTVSPYCKPGLVTLRVTASGDSDFEAEKLCSETVEKLKNITGRNFCGDNVSGIESVVVDLLKTKGLKLAIAESCTAGKISAMLTSVPGASAVFDFGASTYSNEMKHKLLGVDNSVLEAYGAVSPETACLMAKGIRKFSGSSLGLSVTGVAGPKCSENKPVGLVYIALFDGNRYWVEKLIVGRAEKDRERVRNSAVVHALDLVRRYLCYLPEAMPGATNPANPVTILPEEAALAELKI